MRDARARRRDQHREPSPARDVDQRDSDVGENKEECLPKKGISRSSQTRPAQMTQCKFFRRGFCKKGRYCDFIHDHNARAANVKKSAHGLQGGSRRRRGRRGGRSLAQRVADELLSGIEDGNLQAVLNGGMTIEARAKK